MGHFDTVVMHPSNHHFYVENDANHACVLYAATQAASDEPNWNSGEPSSSAFFTTGAGAPDHHHPHHHQAGLSSSSTPFPVTDVHGSLAHEPPRLSYSEYDYSGQFVADWKHQTHDWVEGGTQVHLQSLPHYVSSVTDFVPPEHHHHPHQGNVSVGVESGTPVTFEIPNVSHNHTYSYPSNSPTSTSTSPSSSSSNALPVITTAATGKSHLPFTLTSLSQQALRQADSRRTISETDSVSDEGSVESQFSRDERRARALNIPIPTIDIINLPIDEFNERLSKYDLTEAQLSLIRDIRRRGKNKVAAQNCRKRKMDQIMGLQGDVDRLFAQKEAMEQEQAELLYLRELAREKYAKLYSFFQSSHAATQLLAVNQPDPIPCTASAATYVQL